MSERTQTYSLAELRAFCLGEAAQVEAMQRALVSAGLRTVADARQLARADRFAALARLCDLLLADPALNAELRAAARRFVPTRPLPQPSAMPAADGAADDTPEPEPGAP